jgi:ubiquinone/menaquinone biosynthesis C-methylase UbiE
MWLPFTLLFQNRRNYFFEFKDNAFELSEDEFASVYRATRSVHLSRPTDLNTGCIREIEDNAVGKRVLDVGCGRGFLAGLLSKRHEVTACDMIVSEMARQNYPEIAFRQENIQRLSFDDDAFDTVICSHTLEHVQDAYSALQELRRVTKQRLIIILPKQRPYRYTFDLHLRFFPYAHNVLEYMRPGSRGLKYVLKQVEGDWYYHEDKIME